MVLCIAAFAMVTTEFAPIGLLSQISIDLRQTNSTVGLTVSLYAWIGAASGLLAAVLHDRFPRKPLLILLMLVIALSNAVAATAHSLPSFLLARALGAIAHGIFWAMVAASATQIAPPNRMGLATTIVFAGISIATVMGVPITNLIGQESSWRTAFGVIALLCLATALLMAAVIPKMPANAAESRPSLGSVLRRRDLGVVYCITAFTTAAHFGAYTFVEPLISKISGITAVMISLMLFGFGAAGFLGNLVTGFLIDQFMKPVITMALLLMCVALFTLGLFGPALGATAMLILLVIWGAAIAAFFAGLQTWVLRIAGSATMAAAAVHTTVLNASIGIGAMIGAASLSAFGLSSALLSSAGIAVPAFFLALWHGRLSGTPEIRPIRSNQT
jgi:DHA1 family purine ribonucleoside efflux pump-like MFS transporter